MSSGYEEQELTAIDAALDANPDATSNEVFQATRPFDERAIASAAASRALAGGGGSLPSQWTVGPEGELVVSPDPFPVSQRVSIEVQLPAGASEKDAAPIRVYREDNVALFDLDSYGQIQLQADTVDPTNGGGAIRLKNHLNSTQFLLIADHGDDTGGRAGFFGHAGAPQQVLARPSGDAGDLWDILAAYGLVAAP